MERRNVQHGVTVFVVSATPLGPLGRPTSLYRYFPVRFLTDRQYRRAMTVQEHKQATADSCAVDVDRQSGAYCNWQTGLQQCIAVNRGHLLLFRK